MEFEYIISPTKDRGELVRRKLALIIDEFYHLPFDPKEDKMALNDLLSRLRSVANDIIRFAEPVMDDPTVFACCKRWNEAGNVEEMIDAMDSLLLEARKVVQERNKPVILEGDVSYNPQTKAVFYANELVSHPRANSKEREIWRLLFESKSKPRRVSYEALRKVNDDRGHTLFPQLDDSITSDLNKWNTKFTRFRVSVLHKDGSSIFLKCKRKDDICS